MPTTDTLGGLPLPQDIPFQLIAASPDMMDTRFCNKRFPYEFRSSIAIYAYEPPDLPEPHCSGRITYLKVAVSVTGYKPTQSELAGHIVDMPNVPTDHLFDDFEYITRKYFPCYGALLNVAVFPPRGINVPLERYPHIIAFEPKSRDLMVPTTLDGELLSQSSNKIHTDFSSKSTKTTKLDISHVVKLDLPPVNAEMSGTLSNETIKERERNSGTEMEMTNAYKRGFSTEIEQMYNLMTGYHVGTNRATFMMLPYPHIAQATEFRTFAQGIRVLEGIQEFFLIVARPLDMNGFCIEAGLQTGHFPEDVEIVPPQPRYKTDAITLDFLLHVTKGEESASRSIPFPPGFILDTSRGNGGIDNVDGGSNDAGIQDWENTGDISTDGGGVTFSATAHKRILGGPGSILHRIFTVYVRSIEPIGEIAKHANVDGLLITSRNLCACVRSHPPCLEVVSMCEPIYGITRDGVGPDGREIVDEIPIRLRGLFDEKRPPVKELLKAVGHAMFTSVAQAKRYPNASTGFFDAKFFASEWLAVLPEEYRNRRLAEFRKAPEFQKIPPRIAPGIAEMTVGQAGAMSLTAFAERTGLDMTEASSLRKRIMGIVEVRPDAGAEAMADQYRC